VLQAQCCTTSCPVVHMQAACAAKVVEGGAVHATHRCFSTTDLWLSVSESPATPACVAVPAMALPTARDMDA
jgi:hypothetical protein